MSGLLLEPRFDKYLLAVLPIPWVELRSWSICSFAASTLSRASVTSVSLCMSRLSRLAVVGRSKWTCLPLCAGDGGLWLLLLRLCLLLLLLLLLLVLLSRVFSFSALFLAARSRMGFSRPLIGGPPAFRVRGPGPDCFWWACESAACSRQIEEDGIFKIKQQQQQKRRDDAATTSTRQDAENKETMCRSDSTREHRNTPASCVLGNRSPTRDSRHRLRVCHYYCCCHCRCCCCCCCCCCCYYVCVVVVILRHGRLPFAKLAFGGFEGLPQLPQFLTVSSDQLRDLGVNLLYQWNS